MRISDIPNNEQPFNPPEGYFDTLPQRVARRLRQPKASASTTKVWQPLRLAYVLPVLVVAVAAVLFWWRSVQTADLQKFAPVEELLLEYDISEYDLPHRYSMPSAAEDKAVHLDELLYEISEEDFEAFIR